MMRSDEFTEKQQHQKIQLHYAGKSGHGISEELLQKRLSASR